MLSFNILKVCAHVNFATGQMLDVFLLRVVSGSMKSEVILLDGDRQVHWFDTEEDPVRDQSRMLCCTCVGCGALVREKQQATHGVPWKDVCRDPLTSR